MKTWLWYITFFFTLSSCGQNPAEKKPEEQSRVAEMPLIPDRATGWVTDFEKIFTGVQTAYLDSLAAAHEKTTSNEIAIVSISADSFHIKPTDDFDKYGLSLFNKWGVGKKEKNNGVGILFSIKLRKIVIKTGTGLETKLTNAEAAAIISTIILPHFSKGEYFTGIEEALQAIFKEIT